MDKVFVGVSWKGNPAFGFTVKWKGNTEGTLHLTLFGLELFGLQFKRSKE